MPNWLTSLRTTMCEAHNTSTLSVQRAAPISPRKHETNPQSALAPFLKKTTNKHNTHTNTSRLQRPRHRTEIPSGQTEAACRHKVVQAIFQFGFGSNMIKKETPPPKTKTKTTTQSTNQPPSSPPPPPPQQQQQHTLSQNG